MGNNYIPFGDKWEAMLMRKNKPELIRLYKKSCLKKKELENIPVEQQVIPKIVERMYRKLAIQVLIKMEAPEFAAEEILNEKLDEEDKTIMADLAKFVTEYCNNNFSV